MKWCEQKELYIRNQKELKLLLTKMHIVEAPLDKKLKMLIY